MKRKNESIILIGGGGHCNSCIDVIELEGRYDIFGIIDTKEKKGQSVLNYQIIGSDDDIDKYIKDQHNFLITLGHIKNPQKRIDLFNKIQSSGGILPVIKSPRALISKTSRIGDRPSVYRVVMISKFSSARVNDVLVNSTLLIA